MSRPRCWRTAQKILRNCLAHAASRSCSAASCTSGPGRQRTKGHINTVNAGRASSAQAGILLLRQGSHVPGPLSAPSSVMNDFLLLIVFLFCVYVCVETAVRLVRFALKVLCWICRIIASPFRGTAIREEWPRPFINTHEENEIVHAPMPPVEEGVRVLRTPPPFVQGEPSWVVDREPDDEPTEVPINRFPADELRRGHCSAELQAQNATRTPTRLVPTAAPSSLRKESAPPVLQPEQVILARASPIPVPVPAPLPAPALGSVPTAAPAAMGPHPRAPRPVRAVSPSRATEGSVVLYREKIRGTWNPYYNVLDSEGAGPLSAPPPLERELVQLDVFVHRYWEVVQAWLYTREGWAPLAHGAAHPEMAEYRFVARVGERARWVKLRTFKGLDRRRSEPARAGSAPPGETA
ncbi:hypothetical protein BC834DRAFT_417925 [Gloeopeniophorella convolvens]|nr:hypothetical protein BC834DRAFT_417925 [Gloeopeniophorella convolvens]